jgi:hypothetical protein
MSALSAYVLLMLIALLTSCTRNNGDIGKWFGTWQVNQITVNGVVDSNYQRNIFLKFQNSVVELVQVSTREADHERVHHWGTWAETDGILTLDFTYSDDVYPSEIGADGRGIYAPLPELHLPSAAISALVITESKGNTATLRYNSDDGVVYTYSIKKQS